MSVCCHEQVRYDADLLEPDEDMKKVQEQLYRGGGVASTHSVNNTITNGVSAAGGEDSTAVGESVAQSTYL